MNQNKKRKKFYFRNQQWIFCLLVFLSIPQIAKAIPESSSAEGRGNHLEDVLSTKKTGTKSFMLDHPFLAQCLKKMSNCVTKEFDQTGGEIILPQYAALTIPVGAFSEKSIVTLMVSSDPGLNEVYENSTAIFNNPDRIPYEIRIISNRLPVGTIYISFMLPPQLEKKKQFGVLAQIREENDMEVLDIFEILPSTFDESSGTLSASFPDVVFTDKRHPGIVEAVFVLARIKK